MCWLAYSKSFYYKQITLFWIENNSRLGPPCKLESRAGLQSCGGTRGRGSRLPFWGVFAWFCWSWEWWTNCWGWTSPELPQTQRWLSSDRSHPPCLHLPSRRGREPSQRTPRADHIRRIGEHFTTSHLAGEENSQTMIVKLILWESSQVLLRSGKVSFEKVEIRIIRCKDSHATHMESNTVWIIVTIIIKATQQQVWLSNVIEHLKNCLLHWSLSNISEEARVRHQQKATGFTLNWRRPFVSSLGDCLVFGQLKVILPKIFLQSAEISSSVEHLCSVSSRPPSKLAISLNWMWLQTLEIPSTPVTYRLGEYSINVGIDCLQMMTLIIKYWRIWFWLIGTLSLAESVPSWWRGSIWSISLTVVTVP